MPLSSTDRFYEWEGVSEKWISSKDSFDSDFPSKPVKEGDPLAKWVIEDVFGLTLNSSARRIGSTLPGYDIIGRAPYEIISLSLTAEVANSSIFYECYADGDGVVNYYPIGTKSSNIGRDVLYSIDNGELRMKCDNVMVTGYDTPPKRYANSERNLLTFANYLYTTDAAAFEDKDIGNYPLYTTLDAILPIEACPFRYDGAIEYGGNPDTLDDIYRESVEALGVYKPDEFESVVSYLYKFDIPFFDQDNTTVKFSDTSVRYHTLPGFGELQTRAWVSNDRYISSYCLQDKPTVPGETTGVRLPRSDEFKFKGVTNVYIYGYKLKTIRPNYVWNDTDLTYTEPPTDGTFVVTLDTMLNEPFKLTQGDDYIVVKENDSDFSKIVFSCNVSPTWLDEFGGDFNGGESFFRIDMNCIYLSNGEASVTNLAKLLYETEGDNTSPAYRIGYLSDRNYTEQVDSTVSYSAVIFPTGEGNSGYAVTKIVVEYQWDNPSIIISDLRNNITVTELEKKVKASFYPIILQDEPPPIAFNGKLLDSNQIRPDYDPATMQEFTITEYARAMSSMEAGDVRVTMPFADGDDCIKIGNAIKEMQSDIAHEVVYTCSPDAEPVLGQTLDDGVINEIDYSYQDSSQYLISVTVGPKWRGGTSWDNSFYKMDTDNPVLKGTVLKVSADNVRCNVNINKVGVMECINGTKEILGVGDIVQVTLYNNPVSR